MQIKFFTIPVIAEDAYSEEVNKFLRSVKVLEVNKDIVTIGKNVYWAICVTYFPQHNMEEKSDLLHKGKIDYKNTLSNEVFQRFCMLRKIRKQLADEDAVPAFAVFTDSELSDIAKSNEVSVSVLKSIKGIGPKKIEKYGEKLCDLFSKSGLDEEGRESI